MTEKRTSMDFSKHELNKTINGSTTIYDLKIPNTITNRIKYINVDGILAVTGDYGNWIFCREFHPSQGESACTSYWAEKLRIASSQDPMEFSSKKAREEIDELLSDTDLEFSEEEKEWLDELRVAAEDGENAYISKAMDHPSEFDCEDIPEGKVYKYWFLAVLDGFDEMCSRST